MTPPLAAKTRENPPVSTQEVRVVVADDHALMRSGIMHALRQAPDIRVVGEACDGLGALELVEREQPDVLLLDLHMPRMDGLACLDRVTREWPHLPVLILSVEDDPGVARRALALGAVGYVLKTINPTDLASMVRTAARKQVLFAASVTRPDDNESQSTLRPGASAPDELVSARAAAGSALTEPHTRAPINLGPLQDLSEREREIVDLLCEGRTNKQIAAELYVTTKTVKFHLTNIFAKLGVTNRTEACVVALKYKR
jgi:DNA-binding NarL/FixJ family response regulator